MTLPIALAALTLAAWVAIAITAICSHHKIPRLEQVAPPSPDDPPLPRLSIVVTAHNEERSMEPALRSLLALRYPVLLFTDADVVFAPDAAACGVRHLVRERLDHLAAPPHLTVTGTMLRACTIASHLFISASMRLWKVQDPRSSAFFGVGSYTLMRADSYRAVGGHERVALRPDEDIRLGQVVKMSGMRSTVSRDDSYPWWSAIPFPLAVLVIVYTIWRSMLLTIFRGVVWGGPPVPLSELRAARMKGKYPSS